MNELTFNNFFEYIKQAYIDNIDNCFDLDTYSKLEIGARVEDVKNYVCSVEAYYRDIEEPNSGIEEIIQEYGEKSEWKLKYSQLDLISKAALSYLKTH